LALALTNLPKVDDPRILVGHNSADDAGVLKIDSSLALVTTVDLLAPIVDDPYEYGFIAAINCLSDIYAMGGEPLVCLNVVGWPTSKSPEVLGDILRGGQDAVLQAGAFVLGGHTFQDSEIRYGLAVTGRIDPQRIYTNSNAQSGDALILTKPLGTGTVVQCSISRGSAPNETAQKALTSMKTSNASAAKVMREVGAHACTDVTGFGFLGHCCEMAMGSAVGLEISTKMLPIFPMVYGLIKEGIVDGSHKMNMNSFQKAVRFEGDDPLFETLLYSSETSGGLLMAVDPATTEEMLAALKGSGMHEASVVGTVVKDHAGVVYVRE
jgi:selenide,water dikinase